MKKLILAVALTAAAASPSFAATKHRHVVQPTAEQTMPSDAYAMMVANNVVVQDGQVLGVDPDPFIRGQIAREGNPGDYSN